jgi:uncharacterized protein YbbC (DUF1343 family)
MPAKLFIRIALLLTALLPAFAQVQPGIDVLRARGFDSLRGKRVGLITNQTSRTAAGEPTRSVLAHASGVQLVALFAPEHGIDGTIGAGRTVGTTRDRLTGLPVYSLYGATRKPTREMLRGLDALVFDLQDIGCRSYTYLSTMGKAMEAAGEAGIEFIVLDRPNPLGGQRVEGPPIEKQWISFVGQFPVPYVHGLTAGEMARMANERGWMAARCRLTVVQMNGWSRSMAWPDTGLRWVQTSPNIPNAGSPFYYAATGIAGNLAGLDLGIGTAAPFQRFAAPGVNAAAMSSELSAAFPGMRFGAISPGARLGGVAINIPPHTNANLSALNIYLMADAYRASPRVLDRPSRERDAILFKIYGSRSIESLLRNGTPPARIVASWDGSVSRFRGERGPYLLYP